MIRGLLREHALEALVGLAVVLIAIGFAQFAWVRTGSGIRSDAMKVVALFPNVNGVDVGTDVRVAGLKVGSVSAQELDPKTYQVRMSLALDPAIKMPTDSSAAITSEGLLGGTYVALLPGGDTKMLHAGDVIADTQGSVDLMSMVGQFINRSGSDADQPSTATKDSAQ